MSSSKDLKHVHTKSEASKPTRRLSECLHSADESKNESRVEREHKRRTSAPVAVEGAQEETDTREGKRQAERSETVTEEPPKQKGAVKSEKHVRKEDSETQHVKNLPKKETKSFKEKPEKEKTLSEDKLSVKHKHKGESAHKAGDEAEPHPPEKGVKGEDSVPKQSQQPKLSADDKAERKNKHRNERKLSILGKDGKPVSEYIIKTDENVRKENNKKEKHLLTEKTKAEHKPRRSADSKIQKDSLSSKQHGTPLQRRSESCSEDKGDVDSTHLDSTSKPDEAVPKEKRRTKSLLDERPALKSKSKSQGKPLKVSDTESQEGVTRQTATSKPDKERSTEDSDPDRQRKSKAEDRSEEASADPAAEGAASLAHGAQKDSGHRAKPLLAKDKHRGERESGSSRLERRLSDGHKSRSTKHSSKDMRKKEESKSDDKDGKEVDSNHEKARGNSSVLEKKLSRRPCETRRGSSCQEMTKGEEKLAANAAGTPSSCSLQRPKRGGDATLSPGQEPVETDVEPAVGNTPEASRAPESSGSGLQPDTGLENVMKPKAAATVLKDELRTPTGDAKAAPAGKPERAAVAAGNSEKHTSHKSAGTKKTHIQGAVSRPSPGERDPPQPGTHETTVDSEAGHRMVPRVPAENGRAQKTVKHPRPTEERVAQEGAVHEHSTNLDPSLSSSPVVAVPQKQPHGADVVPVGDRRPVSDGGSGSTCLGDCSGLPQQSLLVRESEGLRSSHSKEGGALSTPDMPAQASLDSKRHIPEGSQATTLHGKQGKVNVPLGSKLTDMIVGHENVSKEGGLMDESRRESTLSAEPTSKQTLRTAAESGRKDGLAVVPDVSMSTAKDAQTGELKHSRGPSEVEHLTVVARRKENSEVDTSAGGSTASSLSHQRNKEAEDGAKPSLTTSTEGKDKGMISNPVNTRAATTTSEAGEGEVALPCTSIEADNGLTRGSITNALHTRAHASPGTVFAVAEEGGAVVTEGFSESETFLTSTKEGDSGECALAGPGEPAVDPAAAQAATVNDSVNSATTEEKDDAVTSAGSEGKCEGSSSQDSERVGGNVTFTGEGESDGAVTSAGTELRERSLSSGERALTRVGPRKEPEGTVTCTGAERGSGGMATCTVTGAGPQEERLVTGAAEVLADNDTPPGASAPQEGGGSVNDGAEGESAVTSTGITEDAEGPASCTGSEEGSEGFALSCESEENGQSATGSTAAKEATDVPLVAAGPGDDEDIVTSTGAKEEDEEGEGVVTSTGRGNELGHASACAGTEESEGVPVCESVEEGDAQIGTAVGHAAAEAGATVSAHESNVDSMSAADKEMKDTEICSSAKGIVESSVTSVASAKAGAALGPEGCEGPMTSAASGQSDSPLARKDHVEETAISTGLVGGSYERLVSAAGPEREVHHMSPREKEDEGAITSVESEERDGRLAAATSDITNQRGGMGLVISTSTMSDCTAQLSARMDGEGHPSSLRAEEAAEGTGVSTEEFEAPMPSADSGEESPLAVGEEEKDECAMISTSLGEECEVPVSSASTILGAGSQQPVTVVGGRAPGPMLVSTDDFEVPMPSAPTKAESPFASTSKEEKDECALISTSVAEGCEACIARVAAESGGEQPGPAVEEKDGSAVISTSSVEDCEGPVSTAVPREQVRPSATPAEEVSDTTVISTSTSEGREAVMKSAGLQDEDRPATTGAEDVSEAALISTSTAECALVLASLDGHGETSLTAGRPEGTRGQSSVKASQCEAPMPSLIAENNCQCPGPLPGGKAVSPEERRDGVPVSALSAGGGQLGEKRTPLSPEAEMAGDSSPASPSAGRNVERSAGEPVSLRAERTPGQTAEGPSISAHSVTAGKAGAEMAEGRPQGRDTAVEQPSLPPAQQDPTSTARVHGQGPDATPAHSALPDVCSAAPPAAACEQDLPVKSVQTPAEKTGDSAVKPPQEGGALAVTVSPEENLGDKGENRSNGKC